jgi:hypothetical protein
MPPAKPPLSQESYFFLKNLRDIDFATTAEQLMDSDEGFGWTRKQATDALTQYMMFLFLIQLYPNKHIVPTREIDRVWYWHILTDTEKYQRDCQMLFGRMLHHVSNFGYQEQNQQHERQTAFAMTQKLFHKHFGVLLVEDRP